MQNSPMSNDFYLDSFILIRYNYNFVYYFVSNKLNINIFCGPEKDRFYLIVVVVDVN